MKEHQVNAIPDCDFCLVEGRKCQAKYFGPTKAASPSHGNEASMCEDHLKAYGQPHRSRLLVKSALFFSLMFMVFAGGCHASPSLVVVAQSQIGKGEIGGNNKGVFVEKYTKDQDVAWCAGFVSWVRFQAGAKHNYLLSARSYWRLYHRQAVPVPRAGDLIVFSRGRHQGHIGIVEKIQGQTITTIEGNVGPYPATVRRFHYQIGHIHHLLGFIRLPLGV